MIVANHAIEFKRWQQFRKVDQKVTPARKGIRAGAGASKHLNHFSDLEVVVSVEGRLLFWGFDFLATSKRQQSPLYILNAVSNEHAHLIAGARFSQAKSHRRRQKSRSCRERQKSYTSRRRSAVPPITTQNL